MLPQRPDVAPGTSPPAGPDWRTPAEAASLSHGAFPLNCAGLREHGLPELTSVFVRLSPLFLVEPADNRRMRRTENAHQIVIADERLRTAAAYDSPRTASAYPPRQTADNAVVSGNSKEPRRYEPCKARETATRKLAAPTAQPVTIPARASRCTRERPRVRTTTFACVLRAGVARRERGAAACACRTLSLEALDSRGAVLAAGLGRGLRGVAGPAAGRRGSDRMVEASARSCRSNRCSNQTEPTPPAGLHPVWTSSSTSCRCALAT
jgi:hypothetical protein